MKTGRVVWDQAVGDPKTGVRLTGGTLVARNKVMVGTTGRAEGGNYIVALDAETGKEAWRFYAIARPDDAGRQLVERDAARQAQRRLGVDSRELRPGAQPGVLRARQHLRHRTAARSRPGRRRQQRRALPRLDARAESRTRDSSPGTSSTRRTASGISTTRSSGRSCSCASAAPCATSSSPAASR